MLSTRWSGEKVRKGTVRQSRFVNRSHLNLESLEDRFLLATRTWTGAGIDANWGTGANWVGGVAPVAGDDLIFPTAAARLSNSNTLTAGTVINSLSITGSSYILGGNSIGVGVDGITANATGAVNTVNLDLILAVTRTITVNGTAPLIVSGVVSGAGGLTKAGTGTLQLGGSAGNTYAGETRLDAGTLQLNKSAGVAVPGAFAIGDGTAGATDTVQLLSGNQIAVATVPLLALSGRLDLGSFAQTLAGLTMTGGTVAGTGTLTLTGNITTNAAAEAATVSVTNLAFDTAARTFTVADGAAADDLILSGIIAGSGELTKAGAGRLVFSGANTYTGATTVQTGTLSLRNAAALGATSAGSTVASLAILELQGTLAVGAEALTFQALAGQGAGILRNVSENNSWAGNINVSADGAIFDTLAGQLTLSGVLSGGAATQTITKRGTGTLVYGGSGANTLGGTTTVAEGVLQLNKTAGVNAIAGSLVIGDGTGAAGSDVVRLIAANQIADAVQITLTASGLLDLNGQAETIGPLAMTGGSVTTGAGTLTLTGNVTTSAFTSAATISGNLALGGATRTFTVADGTAVEDLVLSAVVTGTAGAGLSKDGPGTLRLGGDNTYTGPTTVSAGTLLVIGAQAGSAVTVAAGATLGGTGTVGAITATGTVSPGTTPGVLRSGNVTFNAGSSFRVELNGTAAGTGHDQLNVTGTVNLGNATLNGSLGFTSPGGAQYIIVANDGTDAVTGTFNGLAEGADVTINSRRFTISYRGGDGNDVVLTDAAPATTATTTTLTSTGAASSFGQPVTFTATVGVASGTGTPTGTVTFLDGTTTLGTGTLDANSRATFTTSTLSIGSHQITARYEGTTTFGGSTSAALTQTVSRATSVTSITVTPNPANLGQTVTITATVASGAPAGATPPTGTVTFRDGTTTLGTVTLSPTGSAVFTTSTLTAGAHSLTVAYSGDTNYEGSGSGAVNLQVNQAVPSGTPNQRFVRLVYLDLLNRPAEDGGLNFWVGLLNGGTSRMTVVMGFTSSTEYRRIVVNGLFQKYLRRDADPGGLNAFVGFLGSGGTVDQAAAAIVGSAEYFTRQGGGADASWVDAVYRDVLNRAADTGGRSAHLGSLATGLSRTRVVEGFFASEENRRIEVQAFYQRFLRRAADPGGLNAFVGALRGGLRQEVVVAAFVGSPEYFGRV